MPVRTQSNLKPVPTRRLFNKRYGYELIFLKPFSVNFQLYQYKTIKKQKDLYLGNWFVIGGGLFKKNAKTKKQADKLLLYFLFGWQPMEEKPRINKSITLKTYKDK